VEGHGTSRFTQGIRHATVVVPPETLQGEGVEADLRIEALFEYQRQIAIVKIPKRHVNLDVW